ncbi:GNAT family N-acetyltransferase [Peterkaempfera sp. SMS 1(5)a]|uniref:GNAT family N-acetyltransferase n=1 Tax=Peterkaempfera podocarpi TaxID=3232308 RepID=UPI00367145DA
MREIDDHDELMARCGGDTLCRWAAHGLDGHGRAWLSGDSRAVAIAGPGLSARDRLVVHGAADAAVPLAREVLAEVGPTYRPLGAPAVVDALTAGIPGLALVDSFGWMDRTTPLPPSGTGAAVWLTDAELPQVAALVDEAFPTSHARPGVPGVERWAGVRDKATGRLLAVAALAWSAPTLGLITGVAVSPAERGRGLGREVCRTVLAAALAEHGAAALMVDGDNLPARRLYQGLGMRHRPLRAAARSTPAPRLTCCSDSDRNPAPR